MRPLPRLPFCPALLVGVLAAAAGCDSGGGGGESPASDPVTPVAGTPAIIPEGLDYCADNAYYDRILGDYIGTIVFDDTADGGSYCTWDVAIEVRGENFGTGTCSLRARSSTIVEQSVVGETLSGRPGDTCAGSERLGDLTDPFVSLAQERLPEEGRDYVGSIYMSYRADDAAAVDGLDPFLGVSDFVFDGRGDLDLEFRRNRYSASIERAVPDRSR